MVLFPFSVLVCTSIFPRKHLLTLISTHLMFRYCHFIDARKFLFCSQLEKIIMIITYLTPFSAFYVVDFQQVNV